MDENRYHHLGWLEGIALFEARISDQRFARHSHEGFAIGAIGAGVGGYFCRGSEMVLPPGSLSLMNPEEAHTGRSHGGGLRYAMLYATESAVRRSLDLPRLAGFAEVTPRDRGLRLTGALNRLSAALNGPQAPGWRLAAEEAVQDALAEVFEVHGQAVLRAPGREPKAIAEVRAAIRAGVAEGADLSLSHLAAIAGLHPSYLVRSFGAAVGLSPHAYTLARRVDRARAALLAGRPAAQAAVEAGFCDQSHMIRQMKRQLGVTPRNLFAH